MAGTSCRKSRKPKPGTQGRPPLFVTRGAETRGAHTTSIVWPKTQLTGREGFGRSFFLGVVGEIAEKFFALGTRGDRENQVASTNENVAQPGLPDAAKDFFPVAAGTHAMDADPKGAEFGKHAALSAYPEGRHFKTAE